MGHWNWNEARKENLKGKGTVMDVTNYKSGFRKILPWTLWLYSHTMKDHISQWVHAKMSFNKLFSHNLELSDVLYVPGLCIHALRTCYFQYTLQFQSLEPHFRNHIWLKPQLPVHTTDSSGQIENHANWLKHMKWIGFRANWQCYWKPQNHDTHNPLVLLHLRSREGWEFLPNLGQVHYSWLVQNGSKKTQEASVDGSIDDCTAAPTTDPKMY